MFKVDFMCEDRALAPVLQALAAHRVADLRAVPVVNAASRNGKLVAETDGRLLDVVRHKIKLRVGDIATSKTLRAAMVGAGLNPNSTSYVLRGLLREGVLRNGKKRGTYVVKP